MEEVGPKGAYLSCSKPAVYGSHHASPNCLANHLVGTFISLTNKFITNLLCRLDEPLVCYGDDTSTGLDSCTYDFAEIKPFIPNKRKFDMCVIRYRRVL